MNQLKTDLGTIHYYSRTAKDNYPTIVFLPSFGGDSSYYNFKNIIDKIHPDYGILAIDTIGYGLSGQQFMKRTPENIVRNVVDVLEHERPELLLLFGHSMGCVYTMLAIEKIVQPIQKVYLMEPSHTGVAEKVMKETEGKVEQFKKVQEARKEHQLTPEMFEHVVNPLNAKRDKEENLTIIMQAYGNPAISSEAECTQLTIDKMREFELKPFDETIVLLVSKGRKEEYKQSNYANKSTIISMKGNHFLHWSNEEAILNLF